MPEEAPSGQSHTRGTSRGWNIAATPAGDWTWSAWTETLGKRGRALSEERARAEAHAALDDMITCERHRRINHVG